MKKTTPRKDFMAFPITYRKAENNSWIQCFLCGKISHNSTDAVELYCAQCEFFHTNGIVEESSRLQSLPGDADRNQKLIVALFLALGKAMQHVPEAFNVEVSETEIRKAWESKLSPVRLVSRDAIWGSGNVFKVAREKGADFIKADPQLRVPLPAKTPEKLKRVFDFD